MSPRRCSESIHGDHGPINTTGHCGFGCGTYLGRGSRQFNPRLYDQELDHELRRRPGDPKAIGTVDIDTHDEVEQ